MERQIKIVLTVAEIRKLTVKQLREYNKEKDTVQKKGKQDNTVKQYRVTHLFHCVTSQCQRRHNQKYP
jgi:hypothetical protein